MNEETTHNLNADDKLDLILRQLAELIAFKQFAEPKLYDTRPIWEQALREIMETRQEMKSEIAELRRDVQALGFQMRRLDRKMDAHIEDVIDLKHRVHELEKQDRAS
ncbi:MAG: hypothetical protein ACKV2V_22975 [Blastocatellia bacterium]